MIRTKHKVISIVLCLALVFGALFALSFSAGAATGDKIYVRLNNGWSQVYCYMWTDNVGNNHDWPGEQMTATSESGVYTYTVPSNFEKIIFNNGSGGPGNQTDNLTYTGNGGDGKLYDLSAGTWSQYAQPSSDPVQPSSNPTQPSSSSGGGITVYFKNTANWAQPKCYMWNTDSDNNGWPGGAMVSEGDNVWSYTSSKVYANCIFDNGNSGTGNQTDNLIAMDGQIFDYSTKTWSIYSAGPIKVHSFTADPSSNIYTGMEIGLTAQATSSEGSVSYKFSVNGNVIRDFATGNTATWTPTAAGEYTVTCDFKDTANNTESRTLNVTVASDSGVTSPIIKKVTPAENSYIKKGSAATVSVTAGGGQTGTNLLFYKYIIKDPTGAQTNTAYYTLNSTYKFTPSKEGVYKIEVYVQASDNSVSNKTVNVISAANVPTSSEGSSATVPSSSVQTQPTTPTQPPTTPGQYQLGDVNKDGYVNIKDATHVQLYLIEATGYTVDKALADVNKDGYVTVKDVTAIQRIVAEFV